jgi:hypothetical protein
MRGWDWIIEGAQILSKAAGMWVSLLAALFVLSRLLLIVPLLTPLASVLLVLVTPNFIAGLAHGARALEHGKPLRFGYLVSGFLRRSAALIAVGALSLAGQVVILVLMLQIGGDAFGSISQALSSGGPADDATTQAALRAPEPRVVLAVVTGFVLLVLLLLATGLASLLCFFESLGALSAFALGLRACLKNLFPFAVYSAMLLTPILALMPLTVAIRQPDLGLWLMSPLLFPSLYASYKDVLVPTPTNAE